MTRLEAERIIAASHAGAFVREADLVAALAVLPEAAWAGSVVGAPADAHLVPWVRASMADLGNSLWDWSDAEVLAFYYRALDGRSSLWIRTPNRAPAMVPQQCQQQQAKAGDPAELRATALAFQAADEAWGAALTACFGRRASIARYDALGQGQDGTQLRALYVARYQAYAAWSAARGMPVMPDPVACALTVKAVA